MAETARGYCRVCEQETEQEFLVRDLVEGKAYCPMNEADACRETRLVEA